MRNDAISIWARSRIAALSVRLGWLTALLNLDRRHNEAQLLPKFDGRYVLPRNHCHPQCRKNDIIATVGGLCEHFMIVTYSLQSNISFMSLISDVWPLPQEMAG